jgi:hypothetical protein
MVSSTTRLPGTALRRPCRLDDSTDAVKAIW